MSEVRPTYEELERRCRLAEERLEKRAQNGEAERYRHLFDDSHIVMLVIDPDTGEIMDANRAAADYYGWSRSQLTGMNIGDLNILSKQEIQTEMQAAREQRRQFFRFRHRRAHGDIRDVEVHSGPVVMGDRQLLHSVIHDVTSYRNTEDMLRFSTSWYRIIFEKSPLGMIRFSPDGIILDCNDKFVQLMGSSRKDLIGFNTARQSTPEMRRTIRKALNGETAVFEDEYTSVTGGKTLWLRVVFNPVHPGRRPTDVIATLEDVGEWKQMVDALKKSEERYRDIFNNSLWGIFQSTLEGRFLSCNAAFAKMFGYDSPENLIASITDISQQYYVNPADRRTYIRLLSENGVVENYEFRARCKDGSHIWVINSTRVVSDENGRTLFYEGAVKDITYRKEVESRLKESEERYRRLTENAQDIIWRTDARGELVFVNSAVQSLLGYSPEEVAGLALSDYMSKDSIKRLLQNMDSVQLDGGQKRHFKFEVDYIAKDGRTAPFEINAIVVRNEMGEIDGYEGISRDIAERKRMENDLIEAGKAAEAASRAKSEFIANMSHELRTPLNAVLGYAQVLLHDATLSAHHRRNIAVMRDSGEHLLTLINDILDIARIEAGKLQLRVGPTEIKALIANIAAMLRLKASRKSIDLVEDIDSTLPRFVEADEKRLRQVLLNLLSNAVKFTDNGSVTLRACREEDRIAFSVSDTGAGIPAEKLAAIFDAFHQLNPIAHKTEGTGLGLTISRNLVGLMGGELMVESTVGQGSVFRFQIPLVDLNGNVAAKNPGQGEKEQPPEKDTGEVSLPVEPPPMEDLTALHVMARRGDLSAIHDYATKLRNADPRLKTFCRVVEHCAADCDTTAIRNYLKRYMQSES